MKCHFVQEVYEAVERQVLEVIGSNGNEGDDQHTSTAAARPDLRHTKDEPVVTVESIDEVDFGDSNTIKRTRQQVGDVKELNRLMPH